MSAAAVGVIAFLAGAASVLAFAPFDAYPLAFATLAVLAGLRFQVLRADSRRVYTLLVDKPKA